MTQPPRNLPAADREHISDTLYALTVQIARTLCADDPTERDLHLAVLAAARLIGLTRAQPGPPRRPAQPQPHPRPVQAVCA